MSISGVEDLVRVLARAIARAEGVESDSAYFLDVADGVLKDLEAAGYEVFRVSKFRRPLAPQLYDAVPLEEECE